MTLERMRGKYEMLISALMDKASPEDRQKFEAFKLQQRKALDAAEKGDTSLIEKLRNEHTNN